MQFSVIIPTFNRPSSLRNGLEALRRQVGFNPDLEVIVADDGTPIKRAKQNEAICREAHAQYLFEKKNRGMAVARNRGIVAARGKWLIFMDDDVTCNDGWYAALTSGIEAFTLEVVAFEARINPSGSGVWDREVQNLYGGACLTSHFGVRSEVVDRCGMFDTVFEHKGPYCEDHEFAIRVKRLGKIAFLPHCSVTHAPRNVPLIGYILKAPRRCRELLRSDRYLFMKHPGEYGTFRRFTTFTDTYRSYRYRHLVNVLRRRSIKSLIAHPLQTIVLVIAGVVEQVTAWLLLPVLGCRERSPVGRNHHAN